MFSAVVVPTWEVSPLHDGPKTLEKFGDGPPGPGLAASFTVAGTSFHQPELKKLRDLLDANGHGQHGHSEDSLFTAQLLPDPGNKADPGAVAVFAGLLHVGYMSKLDLDKVWSKGSVQITYRHFLLNKIAVLREELIRPAICRARLLQGTGKKLFGVRVYLDMAIFKPPATVTNTVMISSPPNVSITSAKINYFNYTETKSNIKFLPGVIT